MKLLVLGGTKFVGRHIVGAALTAGHRVTLFNRGTDPSVFPDVERRIGDRDGGLDALGDGTWDAVIDVSGYLPRLVAASARLLEDRVARYAFVSTNAVYEEPAVPPIDEDAPLAELDDPTTEAVDGTSYGGLKVLCERAVDRVYGERALYARPGLVVGPFDHSGRFTYWVRRVAEGGEVLAPEGPHAPTQWIDARDLAAWLIGAVERELSGPYNLVVPTGSVTFGSMLAAIARESGSDARITWVDGDFLLERGVRGSIDLPLWLRGPKTGLFRPDLYGTDSSRALAAGLVITPLAVTVRDTLDWDASRRGTPLIAGMTREREREVLAAWRGREA